MPWIIGGAVLGSALIGGSAAKSAAGTQAGAADQAAQLQQQQYQQTRSDLMPWQQSGMTSLANLNYLAGIAPPGTSTPSSGQVAGATGMGYGSLLQPFGLDQFQASPAYNFNLEQGQQAINKAAASRNMYYAPATLQDLTKYSQGLASNEFQNSFNNYNTNLNNIWNRLYGLSGTGQNAASQTGAFVAGAATNIGQDITGAANASAAGTVGMSNAITGALGQGTNAYLMNQILQQNQVPFYGVGASPY